MTPTQMTPAERLVATQLRVLADIAVTEQDLQAAHHRLRASLDAGPPGQASTGRIRLLAGAAAVFLVVAAVAAWASARHQHTPEPAPPVPSVHDHAVLAVDTATEEVKQVAGKPLPTLPGSPVHAESLTFSPDGTRIFYASVNGDLISLDLTTGKETKLGHCPPPRGDTCAGMVAPDGQRVAYALGHVVYVKDLRTGVTQAVFQPHNATVDSWINALSWAPDGRRLAFVENSWGTSKSAWLTVLDPATGKTTHAAADLETEGPPAWSPDGTTLAYIRATPPSGNASSPTLTTVPADGGTPRQVHPLGPCNNCGLVGLAWSPDGTQLAVTLPSTPDGGPIYSVHTDGTKWHKLANGTFYYGLAWQPTTPPKP